MSVDLEDRGGEPLARDDGRGGGPGTRRGPVAGLPAAEVAARQKRHGPNALRSAPPTPWWKLLLSQFTDGLILVLMGAAVLSLVIGELEEAAFIAVLLVFNGLLGFWQETKAQRSLWISVGAVALAQLVIVKVEWLRGFFEA